MSAARRGTKAVLRGVVFDMDGTLTKPNLDFAQMYQRCGVPMSADLLSAIAAMPPDRAASARAVVDEMEAEGRRTLELCPGASELARWLSERGVRTALVTRNSSLTVEHLQNNLWRPAGLPPLSPALSRDDNVGPPKPNPAALRAIAAHWDVPLGSGIVMVGDSPKNDVLFGKAAGVSTALVDSGRRVLDGGAGADDGGANFVVSNLSELPALLDSSYRTRLSALPVEPFSHLKQQAPLPTGGLAPAAASGDVAALASAPRSALDAVDETGNTPLIWAANAGQLEVVHFLLAAGVDRNTSGFLGATALSRACRWGHADVVRALLAGEGGVPGADAEIPNERWQFPMHFAAFKKHHDIVRLLLEHGASTTVTDRKGRTPAEDTSVAEIREAILAERARRMALSGIAAVAV